MTNRLELFRQQIAAFDGAGDPVGAIEKGYYIEEPHYSSTNTLLKRISLRPKSKNLLIGGIGFGKTTQLLRLQQLLKDTSDADVYPHYVDVTRYTQADDIHTKTIDAIIGVELLRIYRQAGIRIEPHLAEMIEEYAYGKTEIIDKTQPEIVRSSTQVIQHPGILSSHRRVDSPELVSVLSNLIKSFQFQVSQTLFFLLDGLDRLENREIFIQIVSRNLLAVHSGFLIVGSIDLLYSRFFDSLDSIFHHFEYRSAFDVDQDEEANRFFKDILLARSTEDFLQKDALRDLIYLSGGVLRDLINLTQEAIQEAYLSDSERVDQQHVEKAVTSLGRAKLLGLDKKQYDALKNVARNDLEAPTSPEEIYLLSSGRILEYRFPERRFDLHPVLHELFKNRGWMGT
jgi:energy-coupling factor transporter ATP-binding protein EcfA2